jgi:hypothetical protein
MVSLSRARLNVRLFSLGVPQRYDNGSFKCEISNIEMHEDKIKDDTYRFFSLKVNT